MTYLIIKHDIDIMEFTDEVFEIASIEEIVNTEEEAKKRVYELSTKSELPERYPYYTYEENKYGVD